MEVLFKYIEYHSLSELLDDKGNIDYNYEVNNCKNYEVNNFSIQEIEKIIKDRIVKISILSSIHELNPDYHNNHYCKIIFKNICKDHEKSYFFNSDKKFHFLLNPNFNKSNINHLKDIYSIFIFKNKNYMLKFDFINKM